MALRLLDKFSTNKFNEDKLIFFFFFFSLQALIGETFGLVLNNSSSCWVSFLLFRTQLQRNVTQCFPLSKVYFYKYEYAVNKFNWV